MKVGDFFHERWRLALSLIVVVTGVLAAGGFHLLGGQEETPIWSIPMLGILVPVIAGVVAFVAFFRWYKAPRPEQKS